MAGSETFFSSKAIREISNALTDAFYFGVPRYPTILLPPVTNNQGALAFDTTTTQFKGCDGVTWSALGGGGAAGSVVPGTTTVTGAADAILYADAGGVLRASSAELGFNDATNQLLLQAGTVGAPAVSFGVDPDTGFYRSAANIVNVATAGAVTASFGSSISFTGRSGTVGGSFSFIGGAGTVLGGAVILQAGLGSGAEGGTVTITSGTGTPDGDITLNALTGQVTLTATDTVFTSVNPIEQRRGTDAQTLRIYGTFTDASNYERLSLSTVAGTGATIAPETAGTGADNLSLTLSGVGTGITTVGRTTSTNVTIQTADGIADEVLWKPGVFAKWVLGGAAASYYQNMASNMIFGWDEDSVPEGEPTTFFSREADQVIQFGADAAASTAYELKGNDATGSGAAGGQVKFAGGDGTSGNAAGGSLDLDGGAKAGTGVVGAVRVGRNQAGTDLQLDRTVTAGGTTGAQTINKISGTVNFAAAATTLVVTNSLVTTSSIVHAVRRTNDATGLIASVECAAGSFTIRMTAACTAETSVGFLVTN